MINIQKLTPKDWQAYRDIRLLALKSDHFAFGSSYEEECNLTEEDWQKRIDAMWFAMVDAKVAGLVGLLPSQNEASKHCGHVVSLWVKPEFRGQGIAKAMIQKLQSIASSLKFKKFSLTVSATQDAALGLYQSLGFEMVGQLRKNLFKDGQYIDEYLMEWFNTSSS